MKEKLRSIPLPGQRIIRSAVAVGLCFLSAFARGDAAIPHYSAFAALMCMQPYHAQMKGAARMQIIGTILGAFWGLLLMLVEINWITDGTMKTWMHLLLVPLFLAFLLYTTVLLKVQEMAYFSCTVFLAIVVSRFMDGNPYLLSLNRLIDTVIGVFIGSVVNRARLPRRKNTQTLYVSAMGSTLLGTGNVLSPYSRVELNRLLEDGMNFTIMTVHTQATVRELLEGVHLNLPLITMDGAALYDMKTLRYLKTIPIEEETLREVVGWLDAQDLPFFVNTIRQNLLITRYRELSNEGMRQFFEAKRYSPYRNYLRTEFEELHHVVNLMAMDKKEKIKAAFEEIKKAPFYEKIRVRIDAADYEDYWTLRVIDAKALRRTMLDELEKIVQPHATVTFGGVKGKYDVYIENADRNLLVKKLLGLFEPVDLTAWKSTIRH